MKTDLKYRVGELAQLKNYVTNTDMTLAEISNRMNRSIPSIRQKCVEFAVQDFKRGGSYEDLQKLYRCTKDEIDLLLNIEDPKVKRLKELVEDLQNILKTMI